MSEEIVSADFLKALKFAAPSLIINRTQEVMEGGLKGAGSTLQLGVRVFVLVNSVHHGPKGAHSGAQNR